MLILDMNMPEVSGVEVVKMLRFMDTSARVPVIMLTADATPEAREASITAGANRFLTKPIDARGLLECIASLSKNIQRGKSEKTTAQTESRLRTLSNFEESEWYDNVVLHELDLLGDNADFLVSLIRNFEKEGSDHILKIKQAMYDDYLEYRESLHALKGSATELGAGKLVEACLAGEALKPYDMGSEKINQACLKIEDSFNKTVTALAGAVTINPKAYPVKSND
jgi:two-component system sensor histidine kinase RpfC